MGQRTGIEWTEATWNPIRGCSRVSPGCVNCYAEKVAARFKGDGLPYEGLIAKGGQWNGEIKVVAEKLAEPMRWQKPRQIFVNSMSDLFHPNLSFDVIAGIFGIMAAASWHTFQVLTKRPERALEFFQWLDEHPGRSLFDNAQLQERYTGDDWRPFFLAQKASELLPDEGKGLRVELTGQWPLPNLWLGVSAENQDTADERIPALLECPAAVRWVSAEPLLGPVHLQGLAPGETMEHDEYRQFLCVEGPKENPFRDNTGRINWVVAGGESGPNARPMHPHWIRTIQSQCDDAGVPFLFKQWGEWSPDDPGETIPHKDMAGVLPNGDYLSAAEDRYSPPFDSMERLIAADYVRLDGRFLMFNVGKKQAGRALDGQFWDEYPV